MLQRNKFMKPSSLFIFSLSMMFMSLSIESYDLQFEDHERFLGSLSPKLLAVRTTAAVAGVLGFLYLCGQRDACEEDAEFITINYPYAQAWYDQLILKYPQANLNAKQFLQSSMTLDQSMGWSFSGSKISCNRKNLINIDAIYEKQINYRFLSESEVLYLSMHEFMLLTVAGKIENNLEMNRYAHTMKTVLFLEACKAWYKECFDESYLAWVLSQETLMVTSAYTSYEDAIHEYMRKRIISMVFIELIALFLSDVYFVLYASSQPYKFVCQQAEVSLLEDVVLFLKKYEHDKVVSVKMICDEIEHRRNNQNK